MHPTSAELIAHRDGELPRSSHERVGNHLQYCALCQKEVISIEEDFLYFDQLMSGVDVGPPVRACLLEMQKTMDTCNTEVLQGPSSKSEPLLSPMLLSSIRAELAIYLGAQAAEKVLPRTQLIKSVPGDLISTIEPLMAGLIGGQGASAVTERLTLLCESAACQGHLKG